MEKKFNELLEKELNRIKGITHSITKESIVTFGICVLSTVAFFISATLLDAVTDAMSDWWIFSWFYDSDFFAPIMLVICMYPAVKIQRWAAKLK